MKLVAPIDTSRVPEMGDTVMVRITGVTRAAVVITEPEQDSSGRHRLDLLVLTPKPFRSAERMVPGTEPDGDGWFWRECDALPDLRRDRVADVEKLLTRLVEAENTPTQSLATANFLKGEIHEAIREVRAIGTRLAEAEVTASEVELLRAAPAEMELRTADAWDLLRNLSGGECAGIEDVAPGFTAAMARALRGEPRARSEDFEAIRQDALRYYREDAGD